jgi:hypothetical protein
MMRLGNMHLKKQVIPPKRNNIIFTLRGPPRRGFPLNVRKRTETPLVFGGIYKI